ncbi:hypothetical protein [Streptomyces sp. NPDC004008]
MPKRGVPIDYHRRTALYRLFDGHDQLLYVGITFNPRDRWLAHSATKGWWKQVARREVEWWDTRLDAEVAESKAIRDERPLYNIAGAEGPSVPVPHRVPRARGVDRETARSEVTAGGRRWHRSKGALLEADAQLKSAVQRGRRAGIPVARLAELSGMTREWVARIAPASKS